MDNPTTAIPSKEPMTTTGANKKFPIKLAWLLSIFTLETILKDTKNLISKVEEQDVEERKDSTDETQVNADDQMLEENDIWKQIIEHLSKSHTTLLKPIEMKLIMNNFKFESKYDLMEKISKVCKAILSDYEFNSLLLLCYHLREVLNFCSKPNELLDEIVTSLLPCLYSKQIMPKYNLMTISKKLLKKKARIILKLLILYPTFLKSFNANKNNKLLRNRANVSIKKQKIYKGIFSFTKKNKSYNLLSIKEPIKNTNKENQPKNNHLIIETAKNTLQQIAKWAMFISKYMEECFENRFHNEINFTSKIVAITNERIGIFEKELKDEIQNREKYQRQRVIILNVKAVCSYKRKELQQPQQFDVNDKINKSHYVGYVQRMVRLYEELNQKPHQRFK
ncbi:hypothetical protein T4B_10926 [Trichinella pseudospiralis]|uniref:Uncharacterized protein n=1 Tax=Trichinella pseudospiralis TaxID=6337 RepID=A0A0V1E532_TRIPS|nr:hypothetical protein T4A_577 [Trichinella pseudospiralis]KRZ27297.1 hypothetical protein T4B_10926 [Trichinella pseudospiralis]KRZ39921.1 hypothetical protein T4C_7371 [Trichinella pseudospiralis]